MTTRWDLPKPYPEELAYSVVARYLARWGYIRAKSLLAAHLPHVERRITVEVGPNIHLVGRALLENYGIRGPYIERFTLLPYFLAFLPKMSRKAFARDIASPSLGGQSPGLTRLLGGRSDVTHLRFCPHCQANQMEEYRELFWVRQHQLPGAQLCMKHNCRIYKSLVSTQEPIPRAPTRQNCIVTPERLGPLSYDIGIVESLCRESNVLIQQPPPRNGFIPKSGYQSLLLERGFRGRRPTEIDVKKLDDAMCQFLRIGHSARLGPLNNWWIGVYRSTGLIPKIEHQLLFRMFLTSRHDLANLGGSRGTAREANPFSSFLVASR